MIDQVNSKQPLYSPAGWVFLGLLVLFPALRRITGYLILGGIFVGIGWAFNDAVLHWLPSSELNGPLIVAICTGVAFFLFWLPATILAWLGRKLVGRAAEIIDDVDDEIEVQRLERSQARRRRQLQLDHCHSRRFDQ